MTILILEYQTQQDCQSSIGTINIIAEQWYASQGYAIVETDSGGGVVGKNAATGEDEPSKALVTTWAIPMLSPDGTWYFKSLSNYQEYEGWKDRYADLGGVQYVEKTFPEAWKPIEEDA